MIKPNQLPSPLRVLLVEDSLVNQRVLGGLLRRFSCEVSTVTDGKAAVAKVFEEEFDVVFMDVQMPLMDGLTATRVIRRHELRTASYTPIIAVTAGTDRQTCLEAGMDDYVAKPVRMELIQLALERVLNVCCSDDRADAILESRWGIESQVVDSTRH
jgi:CheY-like chemotaxis protein